MCYLFQIAGEGNKEVNDFLVAVFGEAGLASCSDELTFDEMRQNIEAFLPN